MRYCYLRYPEGKQKALTLSYDDGCYSDPKLLQIADRYGIKVTLNINSAWMGREDWHLTSEQLKEIIKNGGHEIAVHGAQHIAPGNASVTTGIADALDCRRTLEKEFGTIIRGMAYPDTGITLLSSGVTKAQIADYLKSIGIVYSRTLGGDNCNFTLPQNFYEWMPNAHHNNPNLMEWLDKFLSFELNSYMSDRAPLLFYLWGHSYEFDKSDNWSVIEEFCQKASGNDNVWYATNIEIYDYVAAYRSLIFSVDNKLVFNPTHRTIWFETDGTLHSIKSGETIEI